jgi:hypothetical protein
MVLGLRVVVRLLVFNFVETLLDRTERRYLGRGRLAGRGPARICFRISFPRDRPCSGLWPPPALLD